jgi:uncharacterized membrane protein
MLTGLTDSLALIRFGGHGGGGGAFVLLLVLVVAGAAIYALAQSGRSDSAKQ